MDYKSTENLIWNSRYFGMYTLFMTLSGLFLGAGSFFMILSLICFVLALYAYSKNKEVLEEERIIGMRLEKKNVCKE